MSSLPFAYSEEISDVVSADDAYDFFWQGKLVDKTRFQCPGNNCSAQVTCANMDKQELELRQSPNFRVYGEHADNCEYLSFLQREGYSSGVTNTSQDTNENNCAELVLMRPDEPLKVAGPASPRGDVDFARKVSGGYGRYTARPKYYSIRSLVDRFFEYHADGVLGKRFIRIGKKTVSYSQLFKRVYKLDSNWISDEYDYIFWGLAYVKKTKNGSFQIRFSGKIIHEGVEYAPSIFVSEKHLEEYRFNKRLKAFLNQKQVDDNTAIVAFIYGKPLLRQTSSGTYINVDAENLDLLDFKSKEYFDKMQKSFS